MSILLQYKKQLKEELKIREYSLKTIRVYCFYLEKYFNFSRVNGKLDPLQVLTIFLDTFEEKKSSRKQTYYTYQKDISLCLFEGFWFNTLYTLTFSSLNVTGLSPSVQQWTDGFSLPSW